MKIPCQNPSLWVGLGGAIGAVCRYGIDRAFADIAHGASGFPWDTFGINVVGALILGWIVAHAETDASCGEWLRCFAGIGFCGAFTTFSSVNLEMLEMMRSQHAPQAAVYLFASFSCGIAAATLGAMLGFKKRASRA